MLNLQEDKLQVKQLKMHFNAKSFTIINSSFKIVKVSEIETTVPKSNDPLSPKNTLFVFL